MNQPSAKEGGGDRLPLRDALKASLALEPSRALEKQIAAAASLKSELIRLTDDADALRDTIEGATTLHEAVRAVLVGIDDDLAMVNGLTDRIAELQVRRDRFRSRIDFKRGLIEQAMQIGEVQKIEADIATVSLKAVQPKALVTDESQIPSEFFEPQPPRLESAKLLAALKKGPVPGATLSNGGFSIQVRRA